MSTTSRLVTSLATTEALAELFSDTAVLQAMLDVEAALARVEARLGVIPAGAGGAITASAKAEYFDTAEIARETLRTGTPAIPLVKALTLRVRDQDPAAAGFVHWGATSQDISDTALVLLLRRARVLLAGSQGRLDAALARLAADHAGTVMLGRTLMQPAPPVTFGLKAAGWLAALRRGWDRMEGAFEDALLPQFGGASGTLASLGDRGIEVAEALAAELELPCPEAPWHAHRDRLGWLVSACGVYIGSLAKMARDLALLMQHEVGEAAEPSGSGRGGSSTMPHKANPAGCAVALAAGYRLPGLVAGFLSAMPGEQERGLGGWHSEWPTMAGVIQTTGGAMESMAEAAEGLSVDRARMRANLEATRGVVFAERAATLLAARMGRDAAHRLLEEAVRRCAAEGRHLKDVLAGMPEIAGHPGAEGLRDLESPEAYLGSAEAFRVRLLEPEE
ncbi:MAG TPA: 3-carboxy-cis,cis-muconate cycloisomerase [Bryobacteraceae bacterium]|nr:3-carboxy-cis,cis-muconate cycloisomerase [Bryobacteraceae bacterium]